MNSGLHPDLLSPRFASSRVGYACAFLATALRRRRSAIDRRAPSALM
jgi:hypothetical protein